MMIKSEKTTRVMIVTILIAIFLVYMERVVFRINSFYWDLATTVTMIIVALLINRTIEGKNRAMNTDDLTGLNNSKSFWHDYNHGKLENLSMIIMDVDNFKKYNDTYGHLLGNSLLRVYGSLILKHFKDYGKAYRFGGEEFIILIKDMSNEEVMTIIQKFMNDVRTFDDIVINTVSVGVTIVEKGFDNRDLLFNVTDKAMYAAKVEKDTVHNVGLINPDNAEDINRLLSTCSIAKGEDHTCDQN